MSGPQAVCSHLGEIRQVKPSGRGCKECLEMGDTWQSFEPGEDWRWCYADEVFLD